ncbi:uncharacterized protein LOC144143404 [Haemaphysalis longicornis]
MQMHKDLVKRERFEENEDEDDTESPGYGDLPAGADGGPNNENNDIDRAAFADADLPVESAQGGSPAAFGVCPCAFSPPQDSTSEYELTAMQKRVADWEARIRPLLDTEEERESFDVRTYCNRVLDSFSGAPSKQALPFRSICGGKPVWEVARYFASTLQLANSCNVQLEAEGTIEEGMDTLQLTLLSRKQHFLELEDFGHSSSVRGTPPSPPARKRKQARKCVASCSHPEDPSDV